MSALLQWLRPERSDLPEKRAGRRACPPCCTSIRPLRRGRRRFHSGLDDPRPVAPCELLYQQGAGAARPTVQRVGATSGCNRSFSGSDLGGRSRAAQTLPPTHGDIKACNQQHSQVALPSGFLCVQCTSSTCSIVKSGGDTVAREDSMGQGYWPGLSREWPDSAPRSRSRWTTFLTVGEKRHPVAAQIGRARETLWPLPLVYVDRLCREGLVPKCSDTSQCRLPHGVQIQIDCPLESRSQGAVFPGIIDNACVRGDQLR